MQSLEMIFREPINIVIFLVLMVAMSAKLTLIAFILLPITVLLIGKLGRSLRRSSSESKERMGTLLSMMDETLGGLRIIKGFNAERKVAEKFETENESFTKLGIKVGRKVDLASPLSETLGVSVLVVLLFIGGKMVIEDQSIDGAVFITYLAMFSQLLTPAKAFASAYSSIQKGLASAEARLKLWPRRLKLILLKGVDSKSTPVIAPSSKLAEPE
jgi:subfamily B ATP-binding cassette protein MsbA